jgi:hypothetical protein
MQKPIFIQSLTHKLLYVSVFLLLASWHTFAQDKATITVKDAKVEERYLEAADGSIRVVKVLTAVDGQYLECSGTGPKSLGPLEQFKGPASCSPTPPRIKPGLFSFDIKVTTGDSLIIHVQPGNQLNHRQIQLKGGGLINLPSTIMATRHGDDQVMLKVIS